MNSELVGCDLIEVENLDMYKYYSILSKLDSMFEVSENSIEVKFNKNVKGNNDYIHKYLSDELLEIVNNMAIINSMIEINTNIEKLHKNYSYSIYAIISKIKLFSSFSLGTFSFNHIIINSNTYNYLLNCDLDIKQDGRYTITFNDELPHDKIYYTGLGQKNISGIKIFYKKSVIQDETFNVDYCIITTNEEANFSYVSLTIEKDNKFNSHFRPQKINNILQ